MLISVPIVTFNVEYLDYSLESSIRCAMDLAEEVVVNDGYSTDNTMDVLLSLQKEYGSDRIRIFQRKWHHDFFWEEKERNFAAEQCRGEWIFFMDVDECFHENSIPKIRSYVQHAPNYIGCLRFPQINFYGTPNFIHPRTSDLPFLNRHAKIGRKNCDFSIKAMDCGNPAELVANFGNGYEQLHASRSKHIFDSSEIIYHYSWARDARAQGIKRLKINSWIDFQNQDEAYYDGYLPKYEEVPFSYDMSKSCLKPFKGSHPKYMESWFKKERVLVWEPIK